jgi:hypothetical protein
MHTKSESDLQALAYNCIQEHEDSDDAWAIFRDEAIARYAAIDDGPRQRTQRKRKGFSRRYALPSIQARGLMTPTRN